ncbi:hypothetical protein AB0D08_10185 [Kitasatospora sp. NPDC048540]|uniref:hypothetical protein n=1 Tax=unclassified Kitasatospora TaxID=2633591 RepID=UPI00053A075D|nr:hypothetical protein [Kitasatospora sp. MBT63]
MDEQRARPQRIATSTTYVTDPEEDPGAADAPDCHRACCQDAGPTDPPPHSPGYWGWRPTG